MLLTIVSKTDSYLQFITVLILFVLVLGITWFVTKWIAKYQKGQFTTGNLEVLETCRVAVNKSVQIVRAGDKYLVIAIGKEEVHMLAELSKEELVFAEDGSLQTDTFANVLERVKRMKKKEND